MRLMVFSSSEGGAESRGVSSSSESDAKWVI